VIVDAWNFVVFLFRRPIMHISIDIRFAFPVNHAAEILPGFVASALGMIVMGWAPDLIHRATNGGRVRRIREVLLLLC